MPNDNAYNITFESQDVVVRLNKDLIEPDALTKFLDYLELETIRKQSSPSEESAATLADEINRNMWSNLKSKVLQK